MTSTRTTWTRPWGYPAAVSLVLAGVAGALLVQAFHPSLRAVLPGEPWNWLLVGIPLVLAFGLARLPSTAKTLAELPVGVAALGALMVVAAPAAIWPQDARAPEWLRRIGMGQPFDSLPFAVACALLLAHLAAALGVTRARPWRARVAFFLLHGGMLVALAGALASAGLAQRGRLALRLRGAPSAQLRPEVPGGQAPQALPFALRLMDFEADFHPPTLALAKGGRMDSFGQNGVFLAEGATQELGGYAICVVAFIGRAAVPADGADPVSFPNQPGAGPAARVQVRDAQGKLVVEGWLHARDAWGPAMFLELAGGDALLMAPRRPRQFMSRVQVHGLPGADPQTAHEVRVNEPLRLGEWKVYQHEFDEAMGDLSQGVSLLCVREPRQGVVVAGLWMMGAGALYLLLARRGERGRQ